MKIEPGIGSDENRNMLTSDVTTSPSETAAPSSTRRTYRLFISTGEVSGDLQGSLLIAALQRQAQSIGIELEILALGGDRMAAAGVTLLGNTSAIGSLGLLEALPHVWPTLQIQRRAKRYLREQAIDLVVLIDYIGPNLNIGKYIRRHFPKMPVVYYIAPQEWVWSLPTQNKSQIVEIADHILAIFPEETRYYQQQGAKVTWVGHPLIDRMQSAPSRAQSRAALGIEPDQRMIALLPASRRQELKYLLPAMFQAAQQIQATLPDVQFWVSLSLEAYRQPIAQAIQDYGLQATLVSGHSQEVIAAADLAISKSGTANLEIALLEVPQVVLYRVSRFTYWIARTFLNFSIPFMSPPNLVEMKPIVPEFLQEKATPDNIAKAALDLLLNPDRRQKTLEDYQEMRHALGDVGVCDRAAQEILHMLPE